MTLEDQNKVAQLAQFIMETMEGNQPTLKEIVKCLEMTQKMTEILLMEIPEG